MFVGDERSADPSRLGLVHLNIAWHCEIMGKGAIYRQAYSLLVSSTRFLKIVNI